MLIWNQSSCESIGLGELRIAIQNLRASNFSGELDVVHRQASSIDGIATLPSITSIPRNVDVALVSLPAPSVLQALRDLESKGCRAAIVPAVGLTAADRDALVELANRAQMLVHGPNTMGLINVAGRIPMVFYKGILTAPTPIPFWIRAQ